MRSSSRFLLACAYLLSAWAAPAEAGTARSAFAVNIALSNPLFAGGLCTSQTSSRATNAIVTVTCADNQFVSIAPHPGSPFLGMHGGAYRFVLGPGGLTAPDDPLWYLGSGTITTLRVYHLDKQQDMMEVEVEVSF